MRKKTSKERPTSQQRPKGLTQGWLLFGGFTVVTPLMSRELQLTSYACSSLLVMAWAIINFLVIWWIKNPDRTK